MARVYLARQLSLGREVALKLLEPGLAGDPAVAARFRREAELAARLDHPQVVTVYAVGEANGQPFIAMRAVSGVSLAELLARDGRLPFPRALAILVQIARALDFAHQNGVIHLDVKPSNVMLEDRPDLGERDRVSLVDFGIAQAFDRARQGAVGGTLEYMAPEQALGGAVDRRADLYALGVVAYELLAGRVPFPVATQDALRALHSGPARRPPPLRVQRPELAEPVERAITRMLERQAAARYASAAAFMVALGGRAATNSRPIRGRPTWFPVAAAGLVAGALMLALLGSRPSLNPSSVPSSEAAALAPTSPPAPISTSGPATADQAWAAALGQLDLRWPSGNWPGVVALLDSYRAAYPGANEEASATKLYAALLELGQQQTQVRPAEAVATCQRALALRSGGAEARDCLLALTPTATPTPAPDQAWLATQGQLGPPWNAQDWPAAIDLIDDFAARYPNYPPADDKLYGILVEYGKMLLQQSQRAEATAQLTRARGLLPDRSEAVTLLIALTPTAVPAPPKPVPPQGASSGSEGSAGTSNSARRTAVPAQPPPPPPPPPTQQPLPVKPPIVTATATRP